MLNAKALVWLGGRLYDVAAGWKRVSHGGSRPDGQRYSSLQAEFDEAARAPDESLVALISSVGTKALLLEPDGPVVRELRRSYYHATQYRYPLALFTLPNGRTGLAHCPNRYNQLELEDARTGERLGRSSERRPQDIFHSRLAVSDCGAYLLSAGWLWQPWGALMVYDLGAALRDPARLDGFGLFDLRGLIQAEVAGAAFVGGDVVISTSDEENDPDGPDDLGPRMLVRYSLTSLSYVWRRHLTGSVGDLLPMADGVLSLQEHPRWHDPTTGVTAYEWPDLPTGVADSAIVPSNAFSGRARVAVDEPSRRFAHTDGNQVTVVTWDR